MHSVHFSLLPFSSFLASVRDRRAICTDPCCDSWGLFFPLSSSSLRVYPKILHWIYQIKSILFCKEWAVSIPNISGRCYSGKRKTFELRHQVQKKWELNSAKVTSLGKNLPSGRALGREGGEQLQRGAEISHCRPGALWRCCGWSHVVHSNSAERRAMPWAPCPQNRRFIQPLLCFRWNHHQLPLTHWHCSGPCQAETLFAVISSFVSMEGNFLKKVN